MYVYMRNPGNFSTITRQIKYRYLLLYEHIHSALRKDFFFMTPPSQIEMIGIVAKYTIQILLKNTPFKYYLKKVNEVISVNEVTNAYVHVYIFICVCVYV